MVANLHISVTLLCPPRSRWLPHFHLGHCWGVNYHIKILKNLSFQLTFHFDQPLQRGWTSGKISSMLYPLFCSIHCTLTWVKREFFFPLGALWPDPFHRLESLQVCVSPVGYRVTRLRSRGIDPCLVILLLSEAMPGYVRIAHCLSLTMQFLRKKSTCGRHSSVRTVGQKDDPIAGELVSLFASAVTPSCPKAISFCIRLSQTLQS